MRVGLLDRMAIGTILKQTKVFLTQYLIRPVTNGRSPAPSGMGIENESDQVK